MINPSLCNKNLLSVEYLYAGQPANRHSTKKPNTYQVLYIYSLPPDEGLQICPKHVEVDEIY
jgi:hypothetical protein